MRVVDVWVLTITEPREGDHIVTFDSLLSVFVHVQKHWNVSEGDWFDLLHSGSLNVGAHETLKLACS